MITRAMDVIGSAAGLFILSPLLVMIALAVRLTSRGPAIFVQQRVGRGGRTFNIFKFRTMSVDAPSRGPFYTDVNDPRITRVGAFLRRTSLDELPQLWNVLTGDMSLVGPRPDVPEQRPMYSDADWSRRHSVRPGVTGLAQATLRSSATFEERLALDLEYVRVQTFRLYLQILGMTVRQVLRRGSH